MSEMRAKMRVSNVEPYGEGANKQEEITFNAVSKQEGYDGMGSDENNTYARYTPSAELKITIMNPALIGKFETGQEYYLDFTKVK